MSTSTHISNRDFSNPTAWSDDALLEQRDRLVARMTELPEGSERYKSISRDVAHLNFELSERDQLVNVDELFNTTPISAVAD